MENNLAAWVQDGLLFIAIFVTITFGLMGAAWKIGSSWASSIRDEMRDGFITVHRRIDRSNDALKEHDDKSREIIEMVHRNDERIQTLVGNGRRRNTSDKD